MSNSTTLLDQVSSTQAAKEVVINGLVDALSPAALWGRRASTTSGLTWGFYGGWFGGAQIANGTVTLTASTTNYVYANSTTGAVSVNTTGFPSSGAIPLYTVVTGSATVSNYIDERNVYGGAAGGGSGTVTSVALSAPSDMSVSGSPVTGSGTLTLSWSNQNANYVHAGPTSGSAATPTWRALVGADIPVFGASGSSHSQGGVPDPGSTAGTTRYLREDGTWQVPSGSGGSSTLSGLSDVSVTEGAGINGYSLTWNNSTSKWVATNVSGGSSSISENTQANRPAAGTTGRLFLSSDGRAFSYDNGTSWDMYGPIAKITPPVLANFTWVNQGSGTAVDDGTGIYMNQPGHSGDTLSILSIAKPGTTSWRFAAKLKFAFQSIGFISAGMMIRDSVSGKLAVFGYQSNNTNGGFILSVSYFNSPTNYNTNPFSLGPVTSDDWYSIRSDGTNYYFEVSPDGKNWVTLGQVVIGAFLTADSLGYYVDASNSTANVGMRIHSHSAA